MRIAWARLRSRALIGCFAAGSFAGAAVAAQQRAQAPAPAPGVAAFPASAKYIVSQVQQADITELGAGLVTQFAGRTPVMGDLLRGAPFRKADISFDKTHELDLGGVKATLLAVGPTHTRGDTVVWVEDERDGVIFAGDVIMNQTIVP